MFHVLELVVELFQGEVFLLEKGICLQFPVMVFLKSSVFALQKGLIFITSAFDISTYFFVPISAFLLNTTFSKFLISER
jgi:hypothetical protein